MVLRPLLLLFAVVCTRVHGSVVAPEGNSERDGTKPRLGSKSASQRAPFYPIGGTASTSMRFPPIHVTDGLSFSRTIQQLDATFKLQLDGNHCMAHDAFGDNNCHYDWGETVNGNYTVTSQHIIDHGDVMTGDFRIDHVVPYQFNCQLCGEPCVLEIPVIEISYTIDTPPCPLGPTFAHYVKEQLMAISPTGGIRTHLEGQVQLTRSTGETIAQFTVSAYVK